MTARPKFAPEEQLTIEEFLAFTDTRPDEERWELIEGVAIMTASPIDDHQMIVGNITALLLNHKEDTGATWYPLPGIGTIVPVSPRSLPQPDVLVKERQLISRPTTDDALVIFEVLSRSNTKADRAWRQKVYASVPNCQHYVTVSLKIAGATAYDRSTGWKARPVTGHAASLELPALGCALPLAKIYRFTTLRIA